VEYEYWLDLQNDRAAHVCSVQSCKYPPLLTELGYELCLQQWLASPHEPGVSPNVEPWQLSTVLNPIPAGRVLHCQMLLKDAVYVKGTKGTIM
jgi:hypothetical protein